VSEFILMLTHNDLTLRNAREIYEEIADTGVSFVGFKDVGVSYDELAKLAGEIRSRGHTTFLEVVSLTKDDELRSARAALDLGVDYLIGGTRPHDVMRVIEGSRLKYFPYVGAVVGHPAKLSGAAGELARSARALSEAGVDGINLLAFRHVDRNGLDVARAVKSAIDVPLICAGSVDSLEKVRALAELGVWAFTIGGACVQKQLIPGGTLVDQIEAVLAASSLEPGSRPT
jgi:hypothetical protein